ncbi:MAG: hypothetical protein LQ338_000361 [Usnochroma carphineum]|nr:MAG: hypothetical protein LQ338_000361 [Usnochroma carphineum]
MASNLTRIKRVPNPKYQRSGPKSYVHLLNKYKFSPTKPGPYFLGGRVQQKGKHGVGKLFGGKAHVQRVLQKKSGTDAQPGDVPADDQQNDSEYLCPVTIGTPGKTFNLDFDTGSADLWLFSTELPKATRTSGHNVFDPKKSSSFKMTSGSTWKISYGDGSNASGNVGTDNVNVGGLVIKNQSIELAKQLSTQFASGVGDGLLGLAFGSINTVTPKPVATPVENMIAQSDIPKASELFTAYLGSYKDKNDPDHGISFYTFGYIDETARAGQEVWYTPVDNSQGFWQFKSTTASVGSKKITRAGNTAIADTGTTLALVDDSLCQAIYDAIPGAKYDDQQQGYVFPSNTTVDNLPVVSFDVGGKEFAVQKEDLAFADAGNSMTYGGIQSRGDLTFDILGDTWLKAIYAIFDQGNQRFGAVVRNDPTQDPSVPTGQ